MTGLKDSAQLANRVLVRVQVVMVSWIHAQCSSVFPVTDFVNGLSLTHFFLICFYVFPGWFQNSHMSSDCRIWIIRHTVESLYVFTERSCALQSWWENTSTSSKFVCVIRMWFLIELMKPSGNIVVLFDCCFTKVSPLISYDRDWLNVRQAFHYNSEITKSILGGVLIQLIEIGGKACGYHVDLSLLHSVWDSSVIFQESSLLVIFVAKQFKFSFESLELFHETRIRINDTPRFSNSQNGRVQGQSQFVH